MENKDFNQNEFQRWGADWEASRKRGRIFGGLFLVLIGGIFLAKEMGVIMPEWLYSWKMLLIGIGLFVGIKHRFRNFSWIILIGIGSWGLIAEDFNLHISHVFWPVMIILLGFILILKPRNKWRNHWREEWMKRSGNADCRYTESTDSDDYLDYNVVFGGVKKKHHFQKFQRWRSE